MKTVPYRPERAEAIDVDSHGHTTVLRMLKSYFNIVQMGKTGVRVFLSARNGFHIYCNEGYTEHEAMMLGDCSGRMRFWEGQGYTFTFVRKMDWNNRTIGIEQEVNPLSLPFNTVRNRIGGNRR